MSNDLYEVGDLSGKFGSLATLSSLKNSFNDSYITLFGYDTVIGRSIVIQGTNQRLTCGTIERGYSLKEARQISSIASFHHPSGYAYGYVRFSQLVSNDEAKSETIIELNLRYPGLYNRNTSNNHLWQIFVNSVGVDAVVKETATR